jgi:Tfp pilus assembly protein PilN
MNLSIDKLNILKISGIDAVLGLDLFKNRVRAVELKSRGGILNRFWSTYVPAHYFTLDFSENMSASDRGRLLAEELKKNGIGTRFCVSAIRSSNTRIVTAEIPNEAEDIQAWVAENYEKLVRVPVPLKDLAFSYDASSVEQDMVRCEIAFVRAADRDEIVELLNSAGLHLLNLGLGVRNSEAAFLVGSGDFKEENRAFVFAGEDEVVGRIYRAGKQGPWKRYQRESVIEELNSSEGELDEIVISGPNAEEVQGEKVRILSPLGLSPEYALAAGLAIRGFLPEIGLFDFCPETVVTKSTEEKDKSLLKSTALVLGALLFVLLGLQFGVQLYLQRVSDSLDHKLSDVGPVYSQVNALERQVQELRTELNGNSEVERRSEVARVLNEIAEATPKGVWLYGLTCTKEGRAEESVDLTGYAETSEKAASYLGALQSNPRFSGVQVVRVGVPTETELASFGSNKMQSFTTFEVKLTVR